MTDQEKIKQVEIELDGGGHTKPPHTLWYDSKRSNTILFSTYCALDFTASHEDRSSTGVCEKCKISGS